MTTKTAITPKISASVPFGLASSVGAERDHGDAIATTTTPISPKRPDRLNPPAIGASLSAAASSAYRGPRNRCSRPVRSVAAPRA